MSSLEQEAVADGSPVGRQQHRGHYSQFGSMNGDGLLHQTTSTRADANTNTNTKTTARQSWIHLLKAYVGPGCLSLPWAVSQLGIVLGSMACFILAAWSSYNCWAVLKLKRQMLSELQADAADADIDWNHEHHGGDGDNNSDDGDSERDPAVPRAKRDSGDAGDGDGEGEGEGESDGITSHRHHDNHNHVNVNITYPDVAGWLYGAQMHRFTSSCVCTQQLAICTVFLSFTGANLQAVLEACILQDDGLMARVSQSHAAVITMALPLVMALSCLPNLKALAPVTAAGTVFLLIGLTLLGIVVAMEWKNANPSGMPAPVTEVQWSHVPLAFCAILYSYEGINLILPIESSMARPGKFGSVFGSAMCVTAVIFCLVAGLCVSAFGPVTNGSVTAFLLEVYADDNENIKWILLAANAAVSLSVLVTFPLQLFPCLELMGPWLTAKFDAISSLWAITPAPGTNVQSLSLDRNDAHHNVKYDPAAQVDGLHSDVNNQHGVNDNDNTGTNDTSNNDNDDDDPLSLENSWRTRTTLVVLTYIVAIAIPNVQSLISLAGALAGSSTALIIPPALELAWLERTTTTSDSDVTGSWYSYYSYKKWRSYALLAGGFIFMCIGTGASLLEIVDDYTGASGSSDNRR